MTTQEQRRQMAAAIVDFEARRDAAGHLMVYHLPSGDGGGAYEVAGINARYNRSTAKTLAGLIGRQRFEEAERLATDYIARNTDCAATWTDVPAIEFYLRDCVFNRGARGGALILQRALGVDPDGKVGPKTRAAAAAAHPADVLARLRKAREQYERDVAHRDERSEFWAGLSARGERAHTIAERRPVPRTPAPAIRPPTPIVAALGSDPPAVPPTIDRAADTTKGSNFPPRPDFAPLVTNRQREALFGHYQYMSAPQPGNPEAIRIVGNWERDNIVEVLIPQLRKTLGDKAPTSIRFHRLAAGQLQLLWAEWERAGLLNLILSFGGGFVARFVRGSRSLLSNHAFGSAFDINEGYNPFGQRPVSNGRKGCVRDLVPIANRCGFYWGGHYQSRADGMHFEIAVLDRRVSPQPAPEPAVASRTADGIAVHDIAANAVQTLTLQDEASPPIAPA